MRIHLTELFPFEDKSLRYRISYEQKVLASYKVLQSSEFILTVSHSKNRIITMSGSGNLLLEIPCGRCLTPVNVPVEYRIDRKADASSGLDDEGEEVFFFEEDELDTDLLIEDQVLLNIPMKVLCKEDCKGICDRCGANLNIGNCNCSAEEKSTRMGEAISKAFADALNKM